MQEEQTVSFGPMSNCGPESWYTKLFALYLFIVIVIYLGRIVNLLKLRKAQKQNLQAPSCDDMRADYYAKVHSLKEVSTLTLLVSLLHFAWYETDVFLSVQFEKMPRVAFVLIRAGAGLNYLALGLFFCVVLYLTALLFQSASRLWKNSPPVSNAT
jgi:predicted secreted protein